MRRREVTATSSRNSGQCSGGNAQKAVSAPAGSALNPPHTARAAEAEPTRANAERRAGAGGAPASAAQPAASAANNDAELASPAAPGKLLRAAAR